MSTTGSEPAPIQTRRMSFEESLQQVPRHFGPDGDLLATWREELFGADGVLNDRLAGVA